MKRKASMKNNLGKLKKDFYSLRDPKKGQEKIKDKVDAIFSDQEDYLSNWYAFSRENSKVYPSQGLLTTPHDYLDYQSQQMLPQEKIIQALILRLYFLELFNHPYRIHFLKNTSSQNFQPVPSVEGDAFGNARDTGSALSIGDLGASVVGSTKVRTGRTERYAQGPFIKLGRQARTLFVGSESPDVWNSAASISTMAASHCLTAIPRNGVMADIQRQCDLAKEVFSWLKRTEDVVLQGREDGKSIAKMWKRNVMAALSASPTKALYRGDKLYEAGVRVFRVYSPEPGTGPIDTVKKLRKEYGNNIEIFSGQVVDTDQARRIEEAGADGIFVGIGGGGRCITGVRSGSVVDWPELVWNLRGEINIPIVVQGGASDHVAITLLLGASGIGVSRAVSGGTIESPGGALYCSGKNGKLFKPYGGEASARTKYLEDKVLPFEIPTFVEGETTKAQMSYVKHVLPTLTFNLHLMIEDAILAMVFRNVETVSELQAIDPSPLRRASSSDVMQRSTH